MTTLRPSWFVLLLILIPCDYLPSTNHYALAKVIYVDKKATGDGSGRDWANACTSISSGVGRSRSGDEVWVKSATYEEKITMEEGVALYGGFPSDASPEFADRDWVANETVIDGTGTSGYLIEARNIAGRLDGFTLKASAYRTVVLCYSCQGEFANLRIMGGGGIRCSGSPTFSNCQISSNLSGIYAVVQCSNGSPVFRDCFFLGNSTPDRGVVYACRSSPEFINCIMWQNEGGVASCYQSSPRFVNCTMVGNWSQYGVGGIYSRDRYGEVLDSTPSLENCILWNIGDDVGRELVNARVRYSCVQSGWPGEGNFDALPGFEDRHAADFRLKNLSPCIDAGVDVGLPYNGSAPDVGAWESPADYQPGPRIHIPRILRVASGAAPGGDGAAWESAFPTIRAAVDVASTSDEVWVKAGKYEDAVVMESRVHLCGGFAGTEVLREERDWSANETVIDATGLDTHAVVGADGGLLDGFTVTGGSAERGGGVYCTWVDFSIRNCLVEKNQAESSESDYFYGGGIGCFYGSVEVRDCTVAQNSSGEYGGGISALWSAVSVVDCLFRKNTANFGGGIGLWGANAEISSSVFDGNSAKGGGLYMFNSSATVRTCTFASNSASRGGGVFVEKRSNLTTTDSAFRGNDARYNGGGLCSESWLAGATVSLKRCTIARNRARNGGGIFTDGLASLQLIHCSIVGNTASELGSSLHSHSPGAVNCIFWNPGMEFHFPDGSSDIRFSCVQGGWPGESNIDRYPMFVDPSQDDWRLMNGSPCIDAGTDTGKPFNGLAPDIGAYETPEAYEPDPDPDSAVIYVDGEAEPGGDGSSWDAALGSISASMWLASASDQVHVKAGRYTEAIVLAEGAAVYGGFPADGSPEFSDRDWLANETVIDATGLGTHAVVGADRAILDGFVVTGGSYTPGGGIHCNRTSPRVENCRIVNNTGFWGGGIGCVACSPIFLNCIVAGNAAGYCGGGVVCREGATPTFIGSVFSGNTAVEGGGLACHGESLGYPHKTSAVLVDCTMEGNTAESGGGVMADRYASLFLQNCSISENRAGSMGGGVYTSYSDITLRSCGLLRNWSAFGGGLAASSADVSISECIVDGNHADNHGGGLYSISDSLSVTNCGIWRNSAGRRGGGIALARVGAEFVNCTLTENSADEAGDEISMGDSSMLLTSCILWSDAAAPVTMDPYENTPSVTEWSYCCVSGGVPGPANFDADPLFVDPANGDFHLRDGSPCIDHGLAEAATGNDPDGRPRPGGDGLVDVGAYESPDEYQPPPATILHVRADAPPGGDGLTWEGALLSIQNALDRARIFDEIWVATGEYEESIVLKGTVSVYGGFQGDEVVREERDWAVNHCVIDAIGAHGVTGMDSAILDGFIITGVSLLAGDDRAGIYCDGTSPSVHNCVITGNSGIGVFCQNSFAEFINCTITDNRGSGFHIAHRSYGQVTQCTITDNGGSGVYCYASSPSFLRCIITRNQGPAVFSRACNWFYRPSFLHCTIAGNLYSPEEAAAFGPWDSEMQFTNCIFWNGGTEISSDGAEVTYSCVQGGWPGEGNIDAYPWFEEPADDDWRLRNGSPCIDAGAEADPPFLGAAPDMGAWESPDDYEPGDRTHVPRVLHVAGDADPGGDGATWASAFASITAALDRSGLDDEIWVKTGTYHELVCMEPTVALYGGFAGDELDREERNAVENLTLLDATVLSATAVSMPPDTILDGFSVMYGSSEEAGGVHCHSGTVQFCRITGNGGGGGVYVSGSSTIHGCTTAGNDGFWPTGAGIRTSPAEWTPLTFVTSCLVRDRAIVGSRSVFRSSTILAGVVLAGYSNSFRNCVMTGPVHIVLSAPEFDNCTIWPYPVTLECLWRPMYPYPIWECVCADPEFNNCIVADISKQGCEGPIPWFQYSCIGDAARAEESQPAIIGKAEEVATIAPHFVYPWDGHWGDFHLRETSPCIDAGNPDPAYDDACRPPGLGTVINDMGAYGGPYNCDEPPPIPTPEGDWTPRPTPTVTSTPTVTDTPTPSPTCTPTLRPGDLTGDGVADAKDLFFFAQWWKHPINETNYTCDLVPDAVINETDLLTLFGAW